MHGRSWLFSLNNNGFLTPLGLKEAIFVERKVINEQRERIWVSASKHLQLCSGTYSREVMQACSSGFKIPNTPIQNKRRHQPVKESEGWSQICILLGLCLEGLTAIVFKNISIPTTGCSGASRKKWKRLLFRCWNVFKKSERKPCCFKLEPVLCLQWLWWQNLHRNAATSNYSSIPGLFMLSTNHTWYYLKL